MGGSIVSVWAGKSLLLALWAFTPASSNGIAESEVPPATQPAATPAPAAIPAIGAETEIKPRFELYVPSLHRLASEAHRSHSGLLGAHLGRMLMEMGSVSSEGVDVESAASLLAQMKSWPDTAIDAVAFAADNEGRPQWAVRLDWPLDDLHARLQPLLALEAAETLLKGVTVKPRPEGGYTIALPEVTLAHLLPAGDAQSLLVSHPDLEFPAVPFRGAEDGAKDGPALLVCRLNLKGTEKDSGATSFSSLSAITDVVYSCRVDEDDEWVEQVGVQWPPGIGMLAKAALGKVKQTFFVPDEAYGSVVFNPRMLPGMLDGMAGFGPQMMVDDSGGFTMVGEAEGGPIASHADSQTCVTLLPGTGFMPVPDVVFQVKAKRAEKLIKDLREATAKINKVYRGRERPEPWHEAEVKDRPVFWSDGGSGYRGMMMPFVLRPVLFVTKEIDAQDREREFLVLGWTSTSPQRLVRRWVELPRYKNRRYLPAKRKTHAEAWINWRQAYKWIQPYVNISLSTISPDLLLPRAKEMTDQLIDASLTAKVGYNGLAVSHRGPIPAGVLVVPVLLGVATAESGGSDLARERSACRTLKVLYHHAKLFKQDIGRWPAELAELDGYIDFAGHPYLLKLELSSKKRRSKWMEGLFGSSDEEEEEQDEEEEDELVSLDDELFVISWGRESWTLGIAPDTLEHLEKLYIDQDGNIHRMEKKLSEEPEDQEAED